MVHEFILMHHHPAGHVLVFVHGWCPGSRWITVSSGRLQFLAQIIHAVVIGHDIIMEGRSDGIPDVLVSNRAQLDETAQGVGSSAVRALMPMFGVANCTAAGGTVGTMSSVLNILHVCNPAASTAAANLESPARGPENV